MAMNDSEKEKIEKSVVQVECINKQNDNDIELGTGFFIDNNIVITANHVINKYHQNPLDYNIIITPIKAGIDKQILVRRLLDDKKNNFLATLELEERVEEIETLKFILGYKIRRGDEFFSFGHPECKRVVGHSLQNIVATDINSVQSKKVDWELELSGNRVEDFKGFSGAPVVINNKLIGMVQTESDANGKTISIAMASTKIIKQYIKADYCEECSYIENLRLEEIFNLEIEYAEISDISKIIKLMINIKNSTEIRNVQRMKVYTIEEKIQLNKISDNVTSKIIKYHNESFDIIEEAIIYLESYERSIRSDLYNLYWDIYIDILIELDINYNDSNKIKGFSTEIYQQVVLKIKEQLFDGINSGIPKDKVITYVGAITAYVFYKCKFLIPIE